MLGVFSDCHGNAPALEAVISDGRNLGVSDWICLGDIAFRGPMPEECLRLVNRIGAEIVMGNTDEWLPHGLPVHHGETASRWETIRRWFDWTMEQIRDQGLLDWLAQAKPSLEKDIAGQNALFVHATLRHLEDPVSPLSAPDVLEEAFRVSEYSLVMCGHLHVPYLWRARKCTLINTGSVGRPIDGDPRASYVVLNAGQGHLSIDMRRVAYDTSKVIHAARARQFPWAEEFIKAVSQGSNF